MLILSVSLREGTGIVGIRPRAFGLLGSLNIASCLGLGITCSAFDFDGARTGKGEEEVYVPLSEGRRKSSRLDRFMGDEPVGFL